VVVEGPPGIGKTRLLAEVRDRAQQAMFSIVSARASELEQDYAFGVCRGCLPGPPPGAIEAFSGCGTDESPGTSC
jgi:hypothetical protein